MTSHCACPTGRPRIGVPWRRFLSRQFLLRSFRKSSLLNRSSTYTGADTGFSEGGGGEGQGGPLKGGGVIAPVGEKLLFEHKKNSATRGGG